MTIIEPNKINWSLQYELISLGIMLFLVALFSIYFYNLNVNLNYQLSLQEKSLQQLEVLNGDLKNQLYQILDSRNLTALIGQKNLIPDKNPDYFEYRSLATLDRF